MKLTLLLTISLYLVLSVANAQVGPPICLAGITPSVPTFSLASVVGVVADYTLFCTNPANSPPPTLFNMEFFLNVAVLNIGPWTLTQGPNTYPGTQSANTVFVPFVLYDTTQPALSFELHGAKVDPSLFGPSFVYLETVSFSGPISLEIANDPIQIVGRNADAPEMSTLVLAAGALATLLVRKQRFGYAHSS
jgi:hypothetical protein